MEHGAPALLTVGVLGGMGPAATVDFLGKIVGATPASCDQDHVPAVVWSRPQIPDRSRAILAGDDGPLAPLLDGLGVLERAGADFIAMPCNSAHHWHARLQGRTRAPILHIADAAAAAVSARALGPVGLLSTRGTIAAGIYQARLSKAAGIILPDEPTQALADAAIAAVKAGRCGRSALEAAAGRMLERGAGSVLLACTELPIAAGRSRFADRCIDPTLALAQACVAMSYGGRLTRTGAGTRA
jgi:aspartate racemase